jgi:hypothetical protein
MIDLGNSLGFLEFFMGSSLPGVEARRVGVGGSELFEAVSAR